MKTTNLGSSNLEVSTLCFGGNVFGWTVDEAGSFELLDAFLAAGGNFIDTADTYSIWVPGLEGGESETIIGRWMKSRNNRSQVVLATKVGMEMAPDKKGLSKEYIFQAVEASLQRLQTDYIDLYISHTPDQSVPIEETLGAYAQLIEQGKVRVIGTSNESGESLRAALEASRTNGLPAYQSLQPLYNLYDRADFETELQPVCEEFNLGVTPYSALASGFLTGKYRNENDLGQSPRGGGVKAYMTDRGMKILEALDHVSREHRSTPTAIALAWLMSRSTVTAPIASATSMAQMKQLIAATQIELDAASLDLLNGTN
jgi:aryl-alcohol dehydrogenase-like predicted oxidoreductase